MKINKRIDKFFWRIKTYLQDNGYDDLERANIITDKCDIYVMPYSPKTKMDLEIKVYPKKIKFTIWSWDNKESVKTETDIEKPVISVTIHARNIEDNKHFLLSQITEMINHYSY